MKAPSTPPDEAERVTALRSYQVLDTPAEVAFDTLTELAAYIAGVPIALVSLVDTDRQWFKSRYGLDAPETPRDVSFCGHVVADSAALVVEDAWGDERFADNPLVTGAPRVRFYAGMPLRSPHGHVLGTLCTIDHQPRQLTDVQVRLLRSLADQVVDQLEIRRNQLTLGARVRKLEADAETRSRLASILDSANYAVIETTPEGVIREFNAAAERMLGYRAAELVGRESPALFHDTDEVVARALALSEELGTQVAPGFEAFVAKARRGVPDENEWTYVRRDGTRFPVRLSVTARWSETCEIAGFMGIAADISERRRTELLLRASEQRLAAMFLSMAEGVIIYGADYTILEANPAAARMVGVPRDQLLGRIAGSPGWEVYGRDGHPLPPDEHPSRVTLRTGQPTLDFPMAVGPEGPERRHLIVNALPLQLDPHEHRDADCAAALVTLRDVTRELRIEGALRASEARSRAVIATAIDAILTFDESGTIHEANAAVERLFGYAPDEVQGVNVRRLIPTITLPTDTSGAPPGPVDGEPVGSGGREVSATRHDGSTFPAELGVSAFSLDGQRFFSGVLRDISDRKRVQRLQSEFVSTVSHELRTPLTSIRGALGLVAGGVLGELSVEAKEYVDIALSNSERLVRLINDILDMEKMQAGSVEFRPQRVSLADTVRRCVDQNAGFAAMHDASIVLTYGAADADVVIDPDRFTQALTNLVSNAVKYSPPGGRVEVGLARIPGFARVTVRDHGPGVPKAFQARIFDRFAQADSSTTRARGGTGLGLSITKAIIEQLGGRVAFTDAEGGGACFSIEVPLAPAATTRDGTDDERARVLICEDDPDVAAELEELLRAAGYATDLTSTFGDARERLDAVPYDALTLTALSPQGSGLDFIAELRAAHSTRALPIVVIAGADQPLGSAAVLVTDVVTKPFSADRLLEAVRHAVFHPDERPCRVLHVEDDADIVRVVRRTLPRGWQVTSAGTLGDARDALAAQAFDIVLLDLTLPDGSGSELLDAVGQARVVIFSATDAPRPVSQRVAAALVKSRVTPLDVRDQIIALLETAQRKRKTIDPFGEEE